MLAWIALRQAQSEHYEFRAALIQEKQTPALPGFAWEKAEAKRNLQAALMAGRQARAGQSI